MGFKENLKSELDYQGLQLKELAAKCGISKNTLGNYLTGHNSLPSIENGVKIAQALGVTVEYLVTGKSSREKMRDFNMTKTHKYIALINKIDSLSENQKNLIQSIVSQMSNWQ